MIDSLVATREASGVDFLTLTVNGERVKESAWASSAQAFVVQVAEAGNKLEARGMQGYDGIMAGGAFLGYRADGAMLRVSGAEAERAWENLYAKNLTRVTRIDLQMTVWFDGEPRNLINRALVQARRHRLDKKTARKSESFIAGGEKGDTTYLGSRNSEMFIRIYDKWRESGDDAYFQSVRYEIEYKADKARQIAARLYGAEWAERQEMIRGQVIGTLAAEGVIMPVDVSYGNYERVRPAKAETGVETKLRWLREQVRQSVGWLCEQGYRHEAMVALGLNLDHHSDGEEGGIDSAGDIV